MSKIARIYQGTNEIQKYYQGGVLQRLFFDWKHYIGNELNIEYAKECAGRNVVISGKTTIQGVPSDYTILDYIECTGTQYIDTGFKANTTTTKFVGAFTPTQKVTGGLLGSRNDTASGTHSCNVFVLAEGKFRVDWANGTNVNHTVTETDYVVGTKYEMEITRGTVVINGTTKSFSNRTSIDQLGNFLIGTFNNVTEPYVDGFIGYIHECKLYSNDILVRNFVPVIRNSDNEVGMYDTVTNTFYTNSGVNSFIAGEKVVNEDIESVGENEDNLVTIRNYNYKCDTDNIVLPDGTKNEISYSKGKHIHTRKIGKYIISGGSNETISIRKDLADSKYITFNINIRNNMEKAFTDYSNAKKKMICDKLEISVNEFEDWVEKITKEAICMRRSGLGFCISLSRSKLDTEDTDGFRTWLSNNPITVYYELYSFVDSDLYYNDITYKLDEPLRSLPNGICDTIEGNKLVQRVGKVVLDGDTTSFTYTVDTQNSLTKTIRFIFIPSSAIFNCIDNAVDTNDKFIANYPLRNGAHGDYEYIAIKVMSESRVKKIYLNINRDKLESVDEAGLKKWLEQTPITIYYPLATPIETEITSDMILIKEGLTTLKSTNNITPQIELDCLVRDGFQNMCDNVWEIGDIDYNTGAINNINSSRIRLINYIKVKPNTSYKMDITNLVLGNSIGLRNYDISKTYIFSGSGAIGKISKAPLYFTTPEDCYYIRFIAETKDINFKIYLKEVIN